MLVLLTYSSEITYYAVRHEISKVSVLIKGNSRNNRKKYLVNTDVWYQEKESGFCTSMGLSLLEVNTIRLKQTNVSQSKCFRKY